MEPAAFSVRADRACLMRPRPSFRKANVPGPTLPHAAP